MRITRQIEISHRSLFQYIDIIEKQLDNNIIEKLSGETTTKCVKETTKNFIENFAFHEFWESVFPNQVRE